MDDEKIQTFLKLAETASFTKTAQALHKSQSVVSRQILGMEEELGFSLFTRDNRSCTLTPGGQVFLDGLKELVRGYDEMITKSRMISEGVSGTLTIAMGIGGIVGKYANIINNFRELFPGIQVELKEFFISDVYERLSSGEIDIALVDGDNTGSKNPMRYLHQTICGSCRDCIYISREHPLFDRAEDELQLSDFANDTFVLFGKSNTDPSGMPAAKFLSSLGLCPHITVCDNLSQAIVLLRTGKCVLFSTNHLLLMNDAGIKRLYFPAFDTRNEAFVWYRSNTNPCIDMFAKFLNKFISKNVSMLTYDEYYP